MRKYGILILLILNHFSAFGQSSPYSDQITTHIELMKDTLLLGEPSFFNYVLENHSNQSIFVEEGGDYRSGRKVSFNVYIITSNQDTLRKRELWGAMGGFIGFHEVKPGESRKFKLFLPMWGEIEKADHYTLSVSKRFRVAPANPFLSEDYSKVEMVPKQSSIGLPVVENPAKLEALITDMVNEIKAETQGRIIEGSGFKIGEKTYQSISDQLSDYLRIITELKDDSIVPFLIECYHQKKHFTQNRVINYLAQYANHEDALKVLIHAANGAGHSKYEIVKDSINLFWSSAYTRQVALLAIMQSESNEARTFLLSKKDDEFPHERYMILVRAKYLMKEEDRLKIYHAFKEDQHAAVAKKAKEELKLLEKE